MSKSRREEKEKQFANKESRSERSDAKMIYPKLPKKSIALLLVFLIFTLAAVGMMFVIYFFHTRNGAGGLFVERVGHDAVHDNAVSYSHFLTASIDHHGGKQTPSEQRHGMRKERTRQHHSHDLPLAGGPKLQKTHLFMPDADVKPHRPVEQPSMGGASTLDTIYIDDYDKIKDKSLFDIDNNMAVNQIDYFDRIIADHTTSAQHFGKMNDDEPSPAGHVPFMVKKARRTHKIFLSKQREDKIKQLKTVAAGDDDGDDEDLISSGSGDFGDVGGHAVAYMPLHHNHRKVSRLSPHQRPATNIFRVDGAKAVELDAAQVGDDELPFYHSLRSEFDGDGAATAAGHHQPKSVQRLLLPSSSSSSLPSFGEQQVINQRKVVMAGGSGESLDERKRGSGHSDRWLETRARRILGNVKKSEERSRRLLLCEQDVSSELCRMLFKAHLKNNN